MLPVTCPTTVDKSIDELVAESLAEKYNVVRYISEEPKREMESMFGYDANNGLIYLNSSEELLDYFLKRQEEEKIQKIDKSNILKYTKLNFKESIQSINEYERSYYTPKSKKSESVKVINTDNYNKPTFVF